MDTFLRLFSFGHVRQLDAVAARFLTRLAGSTHLPRDWPWEPSLDDLFRHALHDPIPAAA